MLEFFEQVLGFLDTAWSYLLGTLSAASGFLWLIGAAVTLPVQLIEHLPLLIGVAINCFMVIWIVKGIFGR